MAKLAASFALLFCLFKNLSSLAVSLQKQKSFDFVSRQTRKCCSVGVLGETFPSKENLQPNKSLACYLGSLRPSLKKVLL